MPPFLFIKIISTQTAIPVYSARRWKGFFVFAFYRFIVPDLSDFQVSSGNCAVPWLAAMFYAR